MVKMNPTALVVTGGLVLICCVAMVTNNQSVAIASLAGLCGWLGGNHNGSTSAST